MLSAEDAALTRRPRQLALCLAALAAGMALAVAVSSAGADVPTTASITAKDPYSFDKPSVTIAQGGTVSFSYPKGSSLHNVHFASQPTSCTDLPAAPAGPGWSGSCTFQSQGTYSFVCDQHYFMRGEVRVVDPNAPTTGTTEPPPGVVKVAHRQRGVVVRGSVTTPAGPSAIAVTALAKKSALASRVRLVKIGALKKRSAGTGKTSFALRVNRAARRALSHRHRLAVTLRIAVTPDAGTPSKKTVAVVLTKKP